MATSNQNLFNRRKLALIIGNDNYHRKENKLRNSVKSTEELSALLNEINFDVTMCKNISQEDEMMEIIKKFKSKIKLDDLVFFYFSGHGYQTDNKNYLIPTHDERIDGDENVAVFGIDTERILERLQENKLQCVTILILDCCRPYVLNNKSTPNCK